MFENEFFSGGLLLGALAYIATQLKQWIAVLYEWIKRRYTTKLIFDNHDNSYQWVSAWMNEHYSEMQTNHRRIMEKNNKPNKINTPSDDDLEQEYQYGLTPGIFTMKHRGRRIVIRHERERKQIVGYGDPYYETMEISYWGTSASLAKEIINEGKALYMAGDFGKTLIYINEDSYWSVFTKKNPRSINTVLFPEGIKESLLIDIDRFLDSKDKYQRLGIPWKRGYLMEGPPGNGKTSSIFAIASHLDMPLYMLQLSLVSDDGELVRLIAALPDICLVMIEDIDSIFEGRKVLSGRISFSGFLNVFDGIASQEGKIIFVTTNHAEKLDPALIRHGRIDKRIYYPNASTQQILAMHEKFFPNSNGAAQEFLEELSDEHNMASIQEMLWQRVNARDNRKDLIT